MKRKLLNALMSLYAGTFPINEALAEDAILFSNHAVNGCNVSFIYDDILAMLQTEFVTNAIWTSGVDRYAGPSLAAVRNTAEILHQDLRVYATNDYNVDFPVESITPTSSSLTIQVNCGPFSMREKGLICLLLSLDDDNSFPTEDNFALSVWQVRQIDVSPK